MARNLLAFILLGLLAFAAATQADSAPKAGKAGKAASAAPTEETAQAISPSAKPAKAPKATPKTHSKTHSKSHTNKTGSGKPHGSKGQSLEEPWLGKWVSTDKIQNGDAFLNALGPPEEFKNILQVDHQFTKEGANLYHHEVTIPAKKIKKEYTFKLIESTSAKMNGHPIKRSHKKAGKKLIIGIVFVEKNKNVRDTYEVQGEELVKTSKIGPIEMKRWFTRAKVVEKAPASQSVQPIIA